MRQQKRSKSLPQFATFNAAYCSGFFLENNALVTTMCLLFDRIYLLNQLELVIEFSKKFRFSNEDNIPADALKIEAVSPDAIGLDPFATLTSTQRDTAMRYLFKASRFCERYSVLLRERVLNTDLYPDGKVYNIELITKGPPGGKNTYGVSLKSMSVAMGEDAIGKLDTLVGGKVRGINSSTPRLSSKYLSSLLAMKAVELTLPQTKPAHPETILEARDRLRDLLPSFWGSMFKLSTDFKKHIEQGQPLHEIELECVDYVDTTIRPALIELNSKLEKDRKSWFHKILSITAKETKLIIDKPPLTVADLVTSGLRLGADVTLDLAQGESISHETGLTFLIEQDQLMRKST